jgi:hypothetical protein
MPSDGASCRSLMKVPLSTIRVSGPLLGKPMAARAVLNDIERRSPGCIGVSKAKIR